MFPAMIFIAGGIVASSASNPTVTTAAHKAVAADSSEYAAIFLGHTEPDDDSDFDVDGLKLRKVVENVQEFNPEAWADTALFHIRIKNDTDEIERLTHDDYVAVAKELGVETAAIKAVVDIEAGKEHSGFWKAGYPLINFDLSMFQQFARRRKISLTKAQKDYPVIFRAPDRRKYGSQQGAQYARLEAAGKINKALGVESAFWGMFQIGGFNWSKCGCDSIEQFVAMMSRSERDQLELFARFIESYNLVDAIRNHDWKTFSLRYNGPKALERGYHTRMEAAYRRHLAEEKRQGLL